MKLFSFSTTAIAALLGATGSIAAPAPNAPNHPSTDSVLYPCTTSLYHVSTGAIDYGKDFGLVSKKGDSVSDITTLVTFVFPDSWANRKCRLVFELGASDTSTGSQRADVFSSIAPAGTPASSWPPGNLRDEQLGRIFVTGPGVAVWEQAFNGAPDFDCPAGKVVGGELVGVNDVDEIRWSVAAGSGPRIELI
ncbi:hypothetical protein M432DRAFT_312520 [Thermoascus aurantiacus ATCC 26904]